VAESTFLPQRQQQLATPVRWICNSILGVCQLAAVGRCLCRDKTCERSQSRVTSENLRHGAEGYAGFIYGPFQALSSAHSIHDRILQTIGNHSRST
jgi:hypothetical protein